MKKILFIVVVCLVMVLALSSCGGASTPRETAEKAMKCRMNNDYEGFLRLTGMSEQEIKNNQEELKRLAAMQAGQEDCIKSYEIIEEKIDEEKGRASFIINVSYEKRGDNREIIKLEKSQDGQWLVH